MAFNIGKYASGDFQVDPLVLIRSAEKVRRSIPARAEHRTLRRAQASTPRSAVCSGTRSTVWPRLTSNTNRPQLSCRMRRNHEGGAKTFCGG